MMTRWFKSGDGTFSDLVSYTEGDDFYSIGPRPGQMARGSESSAREMQSRVEKYVRTSWWVEVNPYPAHMRVEDGL